MHFVLKISKLCNLRCTYCYEYEDLGRREKMSLDDLAFFLEGVGRHYVAQDWRTRLDFVLHGGEPMLLPPEFLRGFVALLRRHLGERGIPFRTSLQTNLTRISEQFVDLIDELDIALGVSIDVFGGARLTIAGTDSQPDVLLNLQRLLDLVRARRRSIGAITVMHGGNVGNAVQTFRFFSALGLSYRILPVFSLSDPVPRMQHLTLSAGQVVEAFKAVARAHARSGTSIKIYPLCEFFTAAVRHAMDAAITAYNPAAMEWALIVNTNGDAYNHSEAYSPDGLMGNIFRQPLAEILASDGRARTLAMRAARGRVCDACPHGSYCNRIPMIEALPSERSTRVDALECLIARPMIDFMSEQMRANRPAMAIVRQHRDPANIRIIRPTSAGRTATATG